MYASTISIHTSVHMTLAFDPRPVAAPECFGCLGTAKAPELRLGHLQKLCVPSFLVLAHFVRLAPPLPLTLKTTQQCPISWWIFVAKFIEIPPIKLCFSTPNRAWLLVGRPTFRLVGAPRTAWYNIGLLYGSWMATKFDDECNFTLCSFTTTSLQAVTHHCLHMFLFSSAILLPSTFITFVHLPLPVENVTSAL